MGDFTYLGKAKLEAAKAAINAACALMRDNDPIGASYPMRAADDALALDGVTPDDSAYDAFVGVYRAVVDGDDDDLARYTDDAEGDDMGMGEYMAIELDDIAMCISDALRDIGA